MIQVYKIIPSIDNVCVSKFFSLDHSRLTRNQKKKKIREEEGHMNVRKYFFQQQWLNFVMIYHRK